LRRRTGESRTLGSINPNHVVRMKKEKLTNLDLSTISYSLTKLPWPYKDGSVEEISCVHKLEYIPGKLRIPFMEEIWRVLIPSGKATFITCYYTSPRAIQDPSYEWPPICEQSYLYFNKSFRNTNKLSSIKCDFDFTYGYVADPDTAARNQESQSFWIKHYIGAVLDLQVTLTKRA
jgi:hypothetical protein